MYVCHFINMLPSFEIGGKTSQRFSQEKLLKIMICLGYLDVFPTTTSRTTSWIQEQKNVCFWGSKEVLKATKYWTRKTRKLF